jgi:hypothetical protein
MKNYKCKNGHEFDLTETQGEEWTETEVCPVCKTEDFEPLNIEEHERDKNSEHKEPTGHSTDVA